jgi:hypothetical protein
LCRLAVAEIEGDIVDGVIVNNNEVVVESWLRIGAAFPYSVAELNAKTQRLERGSFEKFAIPFLYRYASANKPLNIEKMLTSTRCSGLQACVMTIQDRQSRPPPKQSRHL